MHVMHRAFLGLGANLGDPAGQINGALNWLRETPAISSVHGSSLYASAPIDAPGQADYVNAVAMVETALAPHPLLQILQALELHFGRKRSFQNAPRTLDLDLLLYDQISLAMPDLKIPHPRMHHRRFVLEPLIEIAPDVNIPGHGSAAQLLARLSDQAIHRLHTP